LCAPEAIMKAMGGYGTDFNCQRVKYELDKDVNLTGLILAKNKIWH